MITRRTFVKSIGTVGVTSGFIPLLSAKNTPDLPPGNDYKALVCILYLVTLPVLSVNI